MKKVLAISIALNGTFVVLAVLCWKELTAHAAGGGDVPVGNGDVNGDGTIDITDPILTLQWLFMGGPAPVPIECLPPGWNGLPSTGQTKCYDLSENEISCDSSSLLFPGQDGFNQAGCPTQGRFIEYSDGTVADSCTGLLWQKGTADVSENGSIGIEDRRNWQEALQYCENLVFAGHSDWRLPNVRELQSIVDYGHFYPSIDPVFEAVSGDSDRYWSSSSFVNTPLSAWVVEFWFGNVLYSAKGIVHYVRAVRSGS